MDTDKASSPANEKYIDTFQPVNKGVGEKSVDSTLKVV